MAGDLTQRTLGEFSLLALIGEGGHGQVYRARQAGLDREAVIKVLGIDARGKASAVERFLAEAKLASRLDHPYAAHVYAFGAEPDGVLWIAMELVRGTPLDRLLEAAPLPLERAVPFLVRLCEVVHTAHDQGIVHRDLKPANVMVISRAGSMFPKLIDLGIALDRDQVHSDRGREPIGTPFYMAPEQWAGSASKIGPRTDIYALGALTYEVLTGRPPFDGDSVLAVAVQHARAAPPRLPDGFPVDLSLAIARAMGKRPDDRFGSALDLAAALGEAAGVSAEVVAPPRLDEAVRARVVARAPQPIAETVALLDTARNPHQAQIALHQLVRIIAQYVGLVALACRTRSGPGRKSDSRAAVELLRGLRRGRLEVVDWWRLARELCRPFASIPDAHPIPELVAMLVPAADGPEPLEQLVAGLTAAGTAKSDDARRSLADTMPGLARLLTATEFLSDYTLVVPREGAEVWMGARPPRRVAIEIDQAVEPGRPLLVGAERKPVVSLWPLVQAEPPTPNAPPELFLLDGTVRGTAAMIAPPHGFERHDAAIWDWLGARLGEVGGDDDGATTAEVAPYHGLTAFDEDDADAFLGREQEIETLVNRLRSMPLVVIVGPSGAGKSSFVRAGVLPALRAGGPVRTVVLRPGHAPVSGLAAQVAAAGPAIGTTDIAVDPDLVGERLRADAAATGTSVVVVVDQFEELFTLCGDATERAVFARGLCAAARSADEPVRVIITLRDDFLVRASQLPGLRDRLAASLHVCTTPAREDLVRILTEPARRAGYEFEDAMLVDEMIEAVADRPGALALLSFAALQLWEVRDRHFRVLPRKAYAALGGVGGALGRHAETTLAAMSTEQQRLVRIAFRQLVTAEGTRAVIGEADLVAALAAVASDPRVAADVVERLIEARIVVASEDDRGEQQIEIAHEALLAAWPRLIEWRREDADEVRFRDHLRTAAKQWDERGRPRGLLWRGDALLEYQLWRSRFPAPLPARDDAFARTSEVEANRSKRLRRVAIATLIVVMAAVSIVLWRLRQRATAAAAISRHHELASLIEQGRQATIDGDSASGLVYLAAAYARGDASGGLRYMLARAHRAVGAYDWAAPIDPPSSGATAVSVLDPWNLTITDDGTRVVAASEARVQVWDLGAARELPSLEVRAVAPIAVAGDVVAVPTESGIAIWSLADGSHRIIAAGVTRQSVTLTRDGSRVLAIEDDEVRRTVSLWDVASGREVGSFTTDLALGPPVALGDGTRFVVMCGDAAMRVWDITGGTPSAIIPLASGQLGNTDPDEHRILVFEFAGEHTARLIDVTGAATPAPPIIMRGHSAAVVSGRISADGTRVVTSSRDRTVKVWDAATGRLLLDLTRHRGMVQNVAFTHDGHRILSRSADRTVRVWDAISGVELAMYAVPDLRTAQIANDGARVVTVATGELKVWPVKNLDEVQELRGHDAVPIGVAFSPDGRWIATEDFHQVVRLWDRSTGTVTRELRDFDLGGRAPDFLGLDLSHERKLPAFDPTGGQLAVPAGDRVAIFDVATGRSVGTLAGHTGLVSSARYLHDGGIVTAGQDGAAIVWTGPSRTPAATLRDDPVSPLMYAEPSADGELVVTAGGGGVTIWRWRTGERLQHFAMQMANAAAFSPAGDRVAACGRDGRVQVWSVADGAMVATADTASSHCRSVRFANDDVLIVITNEAGGRVLDSRTMVEVGRFGGSGTTSPDRWAEVAGDGRSVAMVGADKTARVYNIEPETASADDLSTFVRCEVPLEVVDGRIVPRAIDRAGCRAH